MSDIHAAQRAYVAGDYVSAKDVAESLLDAAPDDLQACVIAGAAAMELGLPSAAEAHFARAAARWPDHPTLLFNRGILAHRRGRHTDAVGLLRRASEVGRHDLALWATLALSAAQVKDGVTARRAAATAVMQFPGDPRSWAAFVEVHHRLGLPDEALAVATRGVDRHPNCAALWRQIGQLHAGPLRHTPEAAERAARAYRAAWAAPDGGDGNDLVQAFWCASVAADWSQWVSDVARIIWVVEQPAAHQAPCPWNLLGVPGLSEATLRDVAARFAGRLLHDLPPAVISAVPWDGVRPLRVGYLGGQFYEHATMYLLAGVLEAHDPAKVTAFGYSTHRVDDRMRRRLAAVMPIADLDRLDDAQAAQRIAVDHLDVLVDLSGYTRDARPGVLARRPAPILVGWLGYPGTMGDRRLGDVLVADEVVVPLGSESGFSETIVRMPVCYQPNDRLTPAPAVASGRSALGLPDDAVVFACFNALYKLNPPTFDAWCRVLTRAPGALLWLLTADEAARHRLCAEAAARGVDSARLVFAPYMPHEAHLERLCAADVALDTWPCTGHTTTSDALRAGVPVLSRRAPGFHGRVSASLLTAAGLGDLVVADDDAFVAAAVRLATDPVALAGAKARARDGRARLFDPAGFARVWEERLAAIVQGGGDGA